MSDECKNCEESSQESTKESTGQYITLILADQDANEIHYRVKKKTVFGKLMRTYSLHIGVPLKALRFLFDGRRIDDTDTAVSLEMEENDVISVFQEQTGGAI